MIRIAGSVLLGAVLTGGAAAQEFPARPIRILVAYTPAGATDILARAVGQKMSDAWGQPVIVDNRPGAAGNIGTELAAKAPADGYTLLMATAGTHGINPGLYRKLNWDPKDFTAVSLVAMVPNILVVNNALPVKTVKELVAYAKANPGKLSYGSPGNGSTAHLSMELFKSMTGIDLVHVPFKGGGPAIADTVGGNTQIHLGSLPTEMAFIRAGKLKVLAVGGPKPNPQLPGVPTISQTVPGYETTIWFGLFAPRKTPADIVARLHGAINEATDSPDLVAKLDQQGVVVEKLSTAEFGKRMAAEQAKWGDVIKRAQIKGE